jgi:hypothetical protein
VLGAEDCDESYTARMRENINRAAACAVHAGLIRD